MPPSPSIRPPCLLALTLLLPLNGAAFAEEPALLGPLPSPTPTLEGPVVLRKLEGEVLEKGTRKPLADVNVYAFAANGATHPAKATTDEQGRFSIEAPAGRLRWVVNLTGYDRYEEVELEDSAAPRALYLRKQSYLEYETTVYGSADKRDDKTRSLDQSQFLTVPGANGDPVKAVQNLPGVNRANAFSSQIIIEGSSPQDTRYDIDNQQVPLIFHFGGLSSVVIPEAVDHVDYLSAGFGPEFGGTTAGLVNLYVRDPQADRLHGFAFVDFFNAGGLVEGPVTRHSSFLIGLRQSYIGFVLGALFSGNDDLDFTAAPDFQDLVMEYKAELSERDSFRLLGIGSRDRFGFVLKQPAKTDPSIRGNFDDTTDFFRLIPEWTHRFDADLATHLSLGLGRDWLHVDLGDIYFISTSTVVTARGEVEDQLTTDWKAVLGIDNGYTYSDLGFQAPVFYSQGGIQSPVGTGTSRLVATRAHAENLGLYSRNTIHPPSWRLSILPSFRLSYDNQTHELFPEPRMGLRYALDRGLTLRTSGGLYSQAPQLQERDPTYGNPALRSERAVHVTLGAEKDFREGATTSGWTVSDDLFYKRLTDVVVASPAFASPSQPLYYDNSGYGHVWGMELLAKYRGADWNGWLAYTLSRSTRGSSYQPEELFAYDQTHNLTAVADKELGHGWKLSGRLRYTTGDPYTPVVGSVFDADNDVYIPLRGDIYSQRLAPFFEIDARFDKKWVFDRWILTLYVDVENVTNHQNPQQLNYSYDYRQSATINGLPFLPTVGVKGEF